MGEISGKGERLTISEQVFHSGFAIAPALLRNETVERLIAEAVEIQAMQNASRGGVRNLLQFQPMRAVAECVPVMTLVHPILGNKARVVRGTLFDKTPDANWKVPWHQDVTIAVKVRIDIDGYGPWSVKEGVPHVQPPAGILEQMVSVRIHLDDCPATNGALRVIPGTHTQGKVSSAEVERVAAASREHVCEAPAGGALLMRPLLFHASSASTQPGHRRVLHFDYAACDLPKGLAWHEDAEA